MGDKRPNINHFLSTFMTVYANLLALQPAGAGVAQVAFGLFLVVALFRVGQHLLKPTTTRQILLFNFLRVMSARN